MISPGCSFRLRSLYLVHQIYPYGGICLPFPLTNGGMLPHPVTTSIPIIPPKYTLLLHFPFLTFSTTIIPSTRKTSQAAHCGSDPQSRVTWARRYRRGRSCKGANRDSYSRSGHRSQLVYRPHWIEFRGFGFILAEGMLELAMAYRCLFSSYLPVSASCGTTADCCILLVASNQKSKNHSHSPVDISVAC